jgi:hypothetical protein
MHGMLRIFGDKIEQNWHFLWDKFFNIIYIDVYFLR